MTTTQPTLAEITGNFLDAILPSMKDGFLIVAIGHGPHRDTNGKYVHTSWVERPVPWPHGRDAAVEMIQRHAQTCDVWICPYLMKTAERRKGNAAYRALLHCDVDTLLDPCKVAEFDGIYTWSGTPGHGHVFIPLTYPAMPAQHDILERGLVAYMGADPGKISENDLLRPPGTFNHKTTPMSYVAPMS